MANTVIKAELRTKAGKGSSRAMRREGRLPAVIYGDKKDAVSISVDRVEIVKQMSTGSFLSTTYDVEVDGKKELCVPRDVQLHPISDWPMHIDFLRLAKNATINIMIPVHIINEGKCPGIRQGGIVNIVRHEVEFECPANAIPEAIEVDLSGAELGDSIHISAVKLPEGVTPTIDDRDFTVATISAPSGLKSAESEESDEEHSVEVEATSQKSEDE